MPPTKFCEEPFIVAGVISSNIRNWAEAHEEERLFLPRTEVRGNMNAKTEMSGGMNPA
jgi:hypothetical protein